MTDLIGHWINGCTQTPTARRTGPVFDPATGRHVADVALADVDDIRTAVLAAKAAAITWSTSSLSERSTILFRMRELLTRYSDDLAAIITAEQGKTSGDAHGEVRRATESVEFACGVPNLLKGELSIETAKGLDVYSCRLPLGVAAGITPFNFPAMVPLWMAANAIACGNTFVLKPSEKVPAAALRLAELWREAGLPDGVFNVVQGDSVAVDALLDDPEVAAISFVGSTPVAEHVYRRGTATGKRVQALGGSKNHMVVLPDADVDLAAEVAVSAAFGAAGERCMAISVAVTVGEIGDEFVDAVATRIPKIRVGPGADPGSDVGPLITAEHRERVAGYIAEGEAAGAAVVVDGRKATIPSEGFFLGPSLLDNVTTSMSVYTDEVFGPVLSVVRAANFDDAVKIVNGSRFGNGAAVFTSDGGAARRFQLEVEVGMVGVNVPIPVPAAHYSFGGWKASLFGDLHMYGPEGISFYTRGKVVTSRWPEGPSRASSYDFVPSR